MFVGVVVWNERQTSWQSGFLYASHLEWDQFNNGDSVDGGGGDGVVDPGTQRVIINVWI